MSVARIGCTGTRLEDGRILIAGGFNSSDGHLQSAQLYDPAADGFSATGSMLEARRGHTATLLSNGKVLITGGSGQAYLSSAELYDPGDSSFSSAGSMTDARSAHTATLLKDGRVLIAGGFDGTSILSIAELYIY